MGYPTLWHLTVGNVGAGLAPGPMGDRQGRPNILGWANRLHQPHCARPVIRALVLKVIRVEEVWRVIGTSSLKPMTINTRLMRWPGLW